MGEALRLRLLSSNLPDAGPFSIATDPFRYFTGQTFFGPAAFATQRAFPDNQHAPAQATAFGQIDGIALNVALDLSIPEFSVAFGPSCSEAVVAVPEAAVYKN